MFRTRLFFLAMVAASLTLTATASGAQRTYKIVGGTTTITFDNGWMGALKGAGVQLSAGNDAVLMVVDPKAATPVYRVRFPIRRAAGNLVSYGTAQGTLLTANHRGTMSLRDSDSGAVTFVRPVAILASPEYSPGVSRFDALLAGQTGTGTQPFIRTGRPRIRAPRDGRVVVTMNNVLFDCRSGLLNGTDPTSPPGSADWFPAAGYGVMGDVTMVLRVKKF